MEACTIFIRDLRLPCIIGVHAHERYAPQVLQAQIELTLGTIDGYLSDRLEDTVDYETLEAKLLRVATQNQPYLIERLAQLMLDACFEFSPKISSVKLELEKPGCLKNSRAAGVILCKQRSQVI